ncbi:MAG TPA: adenylate/guanylate cyclase domain-containing protein [Moraxellaceae bacterium]|nr:adenylate/guanylate cyclase domain-containing protein [Moraxellaceae bacterium]
MQGMLERLRAQPRLLIGLAITLLFLVAAPLGVFDGLERKAYDLRVAATVPGTLDERVVIADIDERSLKALGRWPWSRDVVGRMVDTLFRDYGVRVVGFDVVFAEPEANAGLGLMRELAEGPLRGDPAFQQEYAARAAALDHDAQFAQALAGKNVVLGMVFNGGDGEGLNPLPPAYGSLPEGGVPALGALPQPRSYTANLEALTRNARATGFFDNPHIDEDGIFRRVPLLQVYDNKLYPSLALATLHMALGAPPLQPVMGQAGSYAALEGVQVGKDIHIPTDARSNVLVPWRGRHGDAFRYVSIIDILERKVSAETLKDKIVLVGTTAPGLLDLRSTPLEKTYPGVEVHANIISGVLDDMVRQQPAWMLGAELVMLVVVALLILLVAARLAPAGQVLVSLGLALATLALNLLAWNRGLVLPLASSLLLIAVLFTFVMSWGYFVEAQGKRSITRLFGQYVPPDLVDEMAKRPESISMAGEARELTVLFSDVRDFTSISEGLSATELSALMNAYLTAMTRLIHKHRGTIDKYMGDAIMAFWGAPVADAEHARRALQTALDMQADLVQLQADFQARGWPALAIGIGLNTGLMNVGNMGSEFRMAYTVMGDAVNLGSRLEGLSKNYGVTIVVSEATRAAVPDFAYRCLDQVRVKGKLEPVRIYEPVGPADALDAATRDDLARWDAVLDAYAGQRWDEAERLLAALRAGRDRKLYALYAERIAQFRANPPAPDWDGVYTYTTK